MKKLTFALLAGLVVLPVTGCQTDSRQQVLLTDKTQVALRSVQSRMFETDNTKRTVRTVIATLQDLGFTIDRIDQKLGLISANKAAAAMVKMTVTVRKRGQDQVIVRASAQRNMKAISDAQTYQQFFNSLSQAMFLEAHDVG